ncbi:MAG: PBP1A family penicillin-binding protein [bacterium]
MRKSNGLGHFLLKFILIIVIIGLFVGGGLILWFSTLPIPDFNSFFDQNNKQVMMAESTKIYDRTGKVLLYDLSGNERRTIVAFENISQNVKKATVAIEDSGFYQHSGISITGILRALFVDITSGSAHQGGSTITQQVIKNIILSPEKSIIRKIKEIDLAIKLEKSLNKDQILTLYLNEIPYGGNIYGVEEASQSFFKKSARDLDITEAAYIAALPQAPTRYSPYGNHKDELEARKNLVIKRMLELGMINKDQASAAQKEKIVFAPPENRGIKAPHFVFFVRSYLEDKYGKEAIETKGLRVITTIDWPLQQKAQGIVTKYGDSNEKEFNAHNASLVAIDPKTGQILVMVGSRDYFDTKNEGNFNVAIAHRQPGSSFKPFVYATAFDRGYTPNTVVFDLPTQFDTNCIAGGFCYAPKNYDDKFVGPISLRNALAQSRNIPAIKTFYLAGLQNSIETAKKMGITGLSNYKQYGLTLVLGGGEVTLLDMTSAYGVFANDGVRNPYASILEVQDNKGNVLEQFQPKPTVALNPNSARLISSILTDNNARIPAYGANSALYFPGRQVAAKTGTTNDSKDAWIMGYTPNIAVGAWAGNNDSSPMVKKVAGMIVAPMWNAFMQQAIAIMPDERFPEPAPIDPNLKPVLRGDWNSDPSGVHEILQYVDKDNPLGPAPSYPQGDPQYWLWETPVERWAASNGYSGVTPRTKIIPPATTTPVVPTNPMINQQIQNNQTAVKAELASTTSH